MLKGREPEDWKQSAYLQYEAIIKASARKYAEKKKLAEAEDYISDAANFVFKAIEMYNPSKGAKLSTHVFNRMTWGFQELARGERTQETGIGRRDMNRYREYRKELAHESQTSGRSVSQEKREELAHRAGLRNDKVCQIKQRIEGPVSLDGNLAIGGDRTFTLADVIPDDNRANDPHRQFTQREMSRVLGAAIDTLPEKEKRVFILKTNDEGLTFKDIGRCLKVSESRAFQLYHKAAGRLREYPELLEYFDKSRAAPEENGESHTTAVVSSRSMDNGIKNR